MGKQSITASAAGYAPSDLDRGERRQRHPDHPRDDRRARRHGRPSRARSRAGTPCRRPPRSTTLIGPRRHLGVAHGERRHEQPRAGHAEGPRHGRAHRRPTSTSSANACIRNATVNLNDCAWQLTTRTGAQAHYAVILDQDTKGTAERRHRRHVHRDRLGREDRPLLRQGRERRPARRSTLLTDDQMQPFTASFPPALTGFAFLQAFPVPSTSATRPHRDRQPGARRDAHDDARPEARGPFAAAHYDFLAQAARSPRDSRSPRRSRGGTPSILVSKTVAAPAWTPPPTASRPRAGRTRSAPSRAPASRAASCRRWSGKRAWSITIFDGTTSFTLPGVSPDPLPAGPSLFVASALVLDRLRSHERTLDDLRGRS